MSFRSAAMTVAFVGAMSAFGLGCSGQPEGLVDLTGQPLSLNSIETTDVQGGTTSSVDVDGRRYEISISNTANGPVFKCQSADGGDLLTLTTAGDELIVSATRVSSEVTAKLGTTADAPIDIDTLRARVSSSSAVRSESDALTITLPLSLFVTETWATTAESTAARALLGRLTTGLADWAPTSQTALDLILVDEANDSPSCSGGGSSCSCSAGSTCTSSGNGCSCRK
jgi:hypothetical protein